MAARDLDEESVPSSRRRAVRDILPTAGAAACFISVLN